jgi:hypothetical protein
MRRYTGPASAEELSDKDRLPGNGQVDLIISTARLRCMGYLRDPLSVLPCVGSDPASHEDLPTTELQVFGRDELEWAVLQQRGPTSLGRHEPAVLPFSDCCVSISRTS